jgi:hypothetical protein
MPFAIAICVQLLAARGVLRRKPNAQVRVTHPPTRGLDELLVPGTVRAERMQASLLADLVYLPFAEAGMLQKETPAALASKGDR